MKRTLALLLIALHAPLASAVFKCVDDKGHVLFGDTPPSACGNVPIYELSPSGNVLRRIDRTPTPQQEQLMREERERKQKEARVAAEQRRKDMALLNTYSSANEFDVARDRNIEPVPQLNLIQGKTGAPSTHTAYDRYITQLRPYNLKLESRPAPFV